MSSHENSNTICTPLVGVSDSLLPQFDTITRKSITVKAPRARGVRKARKRGGASDDENDEPEEDDQVVSSDDDQPAQVLSESESENDVVSSDDEGMDQLIEDDSEGDIEGEESEEEKSDMPIPQGTYDFWQLIAKAQWSDRDERVRTNFDWSRYWTKHQRLYIKQEIENYITDIMGAISIVGMWDVMSQYDTLPKKRNLCMHIIARGRADYEGMLNDPTIVVAVQNQENGFERLLGF